MKDMHDLNCNSLVNFCFLIPFKVVEVRTKKSANILIEKRISL